MSLVFLDERFRPAERLRKRTQFQHASRRGRRRSSRHLIVYASRNSLDWSRVGLTVSRKVGNAARRNRWKRRLREIYRRNKESVPSGWDFVVIVKHSAPQEPQFEDLRDEFVALMNEASTPK